MCEPGAIHWIEVAFGECVITERDKWSFIIGMISSLCWVVSSAPQIYQNYKTKRVDGQSPFLFSLLETGNILSLIGVILTDGLITQIITSVLYALLDGIMFVQYLYYRFCKKTMKDESEDQEDDSQIAEKDIKSTNLDNESDYINTDSSQSAGHVAGLATGLFIAASEAKVDYKAPYIKGQLVGSLFGWISGCVYIGSRIPQVIKNFQNRMVTDLSPIYVSFAVFGNTTYFISIILKSTEGNYMWRQTPFIFGALGPLSCDILFLFQMCFLGFESKKTKELDTDSDERRLEEL